MYTTAEKVHIWMSSFDFLTHKKISLILSLSNSIESFFDDFENNEKKITDIVGEKNIQKLKIGLDNNFLESYINNLKQNNVNVITINSKLYPEKLKQIDSPPFILFCKGDINLLHSKCISIVGSRQPTAYGKKVTEMFSKKLSDAGLTIVSGLAYGVDTIAHETCLDNSGKTIAVLGGGFNYIYPSPNTNLSEKIVKNGLLISEYRPSFRANTYTFPIRNRIIAGLSMGVIITEAGERSGSLHTKEYALEAGRDIFAVPGPITSKLSAGTNRLIKSCQGACVTSVEDILSYYNLKVSEKIEKSVQLDVTETLIVKELENSKKTYEQLLNSTKLSSKKLNSCLTSMQIRGIIRKLPGNMYCI